MSGSEERSDFEQRASEVLGESVTRVNGHVRSRLNQARHAAVAEIAASEASRPRSFWRVPLLMPAAGAAVAAAVVAAVLLGSPGLAERGVVGGAGFEDIDLLSDREALELFENGDRSFYEWAAAAMEDADSGATG